MNRRAFLATSTAGAAAATLHVAGAATLPPTSETGVPLQPSGSAELPLGPLPNSRYPDQHIEALDSKRFKGSPGTGAVERVATGFRWAEGTGRWGTERSEPRGAWGAEPAERPHP